MKYWVERLQKTQDVLAEKSVKDIEKQLKAYYEKTMNHAIASFEATHDKLLAEAEEGIPPTPADLYNLDKYWNLQAQLRREVEKLGDRSIALLSRRFELYFFNAYYSLNLEGVTQTFNSLDTQVAQQMINQIWCADGKSWSQRVWDNMSLLQKTLNEGLIEVVAAGKSSNDLKNILQGRFGVSFTQADTLVRTEVSHIQTQAAKKRYQDYGLERYEILGNEDDTCTPKGVKKRGVDCHEMHGKIFYYNEMVTGKNAPPFHPRCRCCIIPVIE